MTITGTKIPSAICRVLCHSAICLIALFFLPLVAHAQDPDAKAEEFALPTPDFVLTSAGDAIISVPASVHKDEPRFAALLAALRQGDAVFTNLETAYPTYTTPAGATSGTTWMPGDPALLKELQWMGFNLFATANNHVFDYGTQGVVDTIVALKQAGASYAGIGMTLGEARAPGYLSTSHGRVALISTTSSFLEAAPAGQARPDFIGRPGLNPLRYQTTFYVDAADFAALSKITAELKYGSVRDVNGQKAVTLPTVIMPASEYAPLTFVQGDTPHETTKVNPVDLAAITHEVRDAKRQADYVVVANHSHEGAPGNNELSADFQVEFAHAVIDAGADVYEAQGPHILRGIEIYKGKVIFYGYGDFFFQGNLYQHEPQEFYDKYHLGPDALPSESFNAFEGGIDTTGKRIGRGNPAQIETMVTRVAFHNGLPVEITITPITATGAPRGDAGYPLVALPSVGGRILERLQRLSQPYGTIITVKNGVGTIKIDQPASATANH